MPALAKEWGKRFRLSCVASCWDLYACDACADLVNGRLISDGKKGCSHNRFCLERPRERRVDRDHQLVGRALARLVLRYADVTLDDVIADHLHDIAAALGSVEQQRKSQALARAERPMTFELSKFRIDPP